MASHALRGMVALSILGTLTGCAVIQSQAVGVPTVSKDAKGNPIFQPAIPDGIPYFLPKRPFLVTVTEPNVGGAPTIAISPGTAEPDLAHRYVLSQDTNLFADNEFNIAVGPNGLLKSSNSTATSQVATTIQNAASSVGMLSPMSALAGANVARALVHPNLDAAAAAATVTRSYACPLAGASYQIAVYPEQTNLQLSLCAENTAIGGPYVVTWGRGDGQVGQYGGDNAHANTDTPISGLFFRHELPYLVRVVGGAAGKQTESDTLITSPDESETDYFPVKRSFFANNTANITVTDGVITAVDQTTKSELASATNIPASWVSSLTTAAGQLFSGLSGVSSDQQKLLQQQISTSTTQSQAAIVAAAQSQFCMKTVNSYNFGAMSAADMATAVAAIKAACPVN